MFFNDYAASFFGWGRVVPTVRGWGVNQACIKLCHEKLNIGGWVHLFVEGKVNIDHRLIRPKWGAAKLLQDAKRTPIVLPMWHIGMDELLPNKKPWRHIPQIGSKVTLVVGDPIDLSEKIEALKRSRYTRTEIRKKISDHLHKELLAVKQQCEDMHKNLYGVLH